MSYVSPGVRREYQQRRYARRRREWLDLNGPCTVCGATENLEVDHIVPETKVSSVVWNWSAERLMTELAKCQVLCHDCHKAKTAGEPRKARTRRPLVHGTYAGYVKRGCRCELCRYANRIHGREYRRKLAGCSV